MDNVMFQKNTKSSNKTSSNNEKTSEKKISDARIVRSPHDRENPYVMTNKNLLFDKSLSPLCILFLVQLLSKPDNWDFRTSALIREIPWLNEKKIHKFWREAIKAGYVKRIDILEKGLRVDCIYYVAETPIYLGNSNNFARDSQKRSCENGSDLVSNVLYVNIKEVVKKSSADPNHPIGVSPTATSTFSQKKEKIRKQQIPFTEDHKDRLRRDWGEKIANPIIFRIETMMRNKPVSYTSTNPYDDAHKFCAEASRAKAGRFTKKVPIETQKNIEEKNIEQINYLLNTYKPSEAIFNCSTDTKMVEVTIFGTSKTLFLDYTKDDFRKKLYEWFEPYRQVYLRKK